MRRVVGVNDAVAAIVRDGRIVVVPVVVFDVTVGVRVDDAVGVFVHVCVAARPVGRCGVAHIVNFGAPWAQAR